MSIKQLNVRISDNVIKDTKLFALEHDLNINTVVCRALEFYLMCQSTDVDLDKINNELQFYLLNDTMKVILDPGITEFKKKALETFKDSILYD